MVQREAVQQREAEQINLGKILLAEDYPSVWLSKRAKSKVENMDLVQSMGLSSTSFIFKTVRN